MPDLVRCVITLGTPFAGHHRSTNAWRIYQFASGRSIERETESYTRRGTTRAHHQHLFAHRRRGGLARQHPGACRPQPAHREHRGGGHFGIGLNPSAWWAVADRLGQPQGPAWCGNPFQRPQLPGLKLLYPDPHR